MSDIPIELDEFGRTVSEILDNLERGMLDLAPEAVEKALKKGEDAWKRNATSVLSASYSRGGWGRIKKGNLTEYKSGPRKGKIKSGWYGRTYRTGKYARSIRHQTTGHGVTPEGEIGSPSMPGLAHLLEKGHAMVDGGKTKAYVHIEPAAEEAFGDFEKLLDEVIDDAISRA